MAMARDWLQTLWPASYKGVPFLVDRDGEEGGRRIVSHEFVMRDDPFHEDLGEKKRSFSVTAYLASDAADADAGALTAICATRGAGVLVLPTHGMILACCTDFRRSRDKDRAGFIAFSLDFVREGARSALVTILSLANLIFIGADSLASAAAASFASSIVVQRVPDYVAQAAVVGVQTAAAALDAIRVSAPVDTAVSVVQRRTIEAIYDAAADLAATGMNAPALAAGVFDVARALGDAMSPEAALRAFSGLWTELAAGGSDAAPALTMGASLAARNASAADAMVRSAALTAYSEAIARLALTDRPAAITLRANVAEYFEAETFVLRADQVAVFNGLTALRDAVIEYISRAVLDLAPVNTVSSNLSMPSLFWSWRLYADPARSAELVTRNRVAHPSFMPLDFEALAT